MTPVTFSEKAEEDPEQIGDFIARDSPARALSFIRELRDCCRKIGQFPESYKRCPDLGRNVRMMPQGNYVVLYRILDDRISVERILHGARDIMVLLGY